MTNVLKRNCAVSALLSSLAIIAVAAAWILAHVAAFVAAAVLCAAVLVLVIRAARQADGDAESQREGLEALPEIQDTSEKVVQLEKEVRRLQDALQRQTQTLTTLAAGLQLFGETRDIVDRLAALIKSSGEESSLRVTEGVFSVAETSLQFNNQMTTLLSDMFTVDQSLDRDVELLFTVISRMGTVAERFRDLGEAYVGEMERLENTVNVISEFTGEIGELSDQTDILAINASVAAARAGAAGKAFGVIAGGIRELSTRSKGIADSIDQAVGGTVEDIAGTFEQQRDRVRESVGVLNEATRELESISGVLASQIKIVGMSLSESQEFAQTVQNTMGDVTVALQADDATTQILDHICSILRDADRRGRAALMAAEVQVDEKALRKDAEDLACRHFSVADEWTALGREPETTGSGESGDLEGDVTLF
jgi:methyl-accepting chemotaxis protein